MRVFENALGHHLEALVSPVAQINARRGGQQVSEFAHMEPENFGLRCQHKKDFDVTVALVLEVVEVSGILLALINAKY